MGPGFFDPVLSHRLVVCLPGMFLIHLIELRHQRL